MRKRKMTLTNEQILETLSQYYADDYCVFTWGNEELEIDRFTIIDEACSYGKSLLDGEEIEDSYYVLLYKNGQQIPFWKRQAI